MIAPAVLFAKALKLLGAKRLARAWLRVSVNAFPRSAAVFDTYCSERMGARDFTAISGRCALVADDGGAGNALREAASSWLTRASLEDDPPADILERLRPEFRRLGALALEGVAGSRPTEARVLFGKALKAARAPSAALGGWEEAFTALYRQEPLPERADAGDSLYRPKPKIVVSGMYWSGSGALYAYFSEFEDIAPVPGELRLWKEGNSSLQALARALRTGSGYAETLARCLVLSMAGVAPVHAWADMLASRCALDALRSDREGLYVVACRDFVESVAGLCRMPVDEGLAALEKAAGLLTDRLAGLWATRSGSIALFDNIVHLGEIRAARLLGDATVLCAVRDPRSNFVARWNENPRFHRDVDRYIKYYRDTRRAFERQLAMDRRLASMLHTVSFERFVSCESYRDRLAQELGLDLARRKAGSRFRQERSAPNALNYRGFPYQDALVRIERALPEYCVDPAAFTE